MFTVWPTEKKQFQIRWLYKICIFTCPVTHLMHTLISSNAIISHTRHCPRAHFRYFTIMKTMSNTRKYVAAIHTTKRHFSLHRSLLVSIYIVFTLHWHYGTYFIIWKADTEDDANIGALFNHQCLPYDFFRFKTR